MAPQNGDKVKIVGNGGAFEGWYGEITGQPGGLITVNLTHDSSCNPVPQHEIEGISPEHVQLGSCN